MAAQLGLYGNILPDDDKAFVFESKRAYAWKIGSTGYRFQNMLEANNKVLKKTREFWQNPEFSSLKWTDCKETQEAYYDFFRKEKMFEGRKLAKANEIGYKQKEVSTMTIPLVNLGLLDEERRLTEVADLLLKCEKDEVEMDEMHQKFNIPSIPYIYLKQMLKLVSVHKVREKQRTSSYIIRPLVLLILALIEFGHLTDDEFKLLMLCVTPQYRERVFVAIDEIRNGKARVDDIIIEMVIDNFAYSYTFDRDKFCRSAIDEKTICGVGSQGKSPEYDKFFFEIYCIMRNLFIEGHRGLADDLMAKIREIRDSDEKRIWANYLFKNGGRKRKGNEIRDEVVLNDESELKRLFFNLMHLGKIKKRLSDYFDITRRYLKIINMVDFRNGRVELDTLPFIIFRDNIVLLKNILHKGIDHRKDFSRQILLGRWEKSVLEENSALTDIIPNFTVNDAHGEIDDFFKTRAEKLGVSEKQYNRAKSMAETKSGDLNSWEYYKLLDYEIKGICFLNFLREKFPVKTLIELLELFKNHRNRENKKKIQEIIGIDTYLPIVFEYVVALAWHVICGYKGNVLNSMNTCLNLDFLPVSNATGGKADIVYHYCDFDKNGDNDRQACYDCPNKIWDCDEHATLIEVTLTTRSGEHMQEKDSISRHLSGYVDKTKRWRSYCLFVAPCLELNIINDLMNLMSGNNSYYLYRDRRRDNYREFDKLRIMPLTIDIFITILERAARKDIQYNDLYWIFNEHFDRWMRKQYKPEKWLWKIKTDIEQYSARVPCLPSDFMGAPCQQETDGSEASVG